MKTPLEILIEIANDDRLPADVRAKAAEAAAPYRHPRMVEDNSRPHVTLTQHVIDAGGINLSGNLSTPGKISFPAEGVRGAS